MKLTHIDNACCIYESKGYKLLADPWLTDGAFEGSWFHYPPLVTTFEDIKDVDALYISHLHPDHYDETILKQFRRDIPILVLDHGANFLIKKLTALGFTHLNKLKDKQTAIMGPMEVTLYAPFVSHPFDNSNLGNFIDSAMVVEAEGKVVLNANDNTPDKAAGKMLYDRHGKFSVVQLKDSLAGAYPSCFTNLTSDQKLSEAKRLINRQLIAMCQVADTMKAEWFQPFAGDYTLGGRLADKNPYLGVAGKQYSAQFIASRYSEKYGILTKPLILNERGSLDLVTGELLSSYRNSIISYEKWLERAKQIKYPYELDPTVSMDDLTDKLNTARERLAKFQDKHHYYPNLVISINGYKFFMGDEKMNFMNSKPNRIEFTLDNRALSGVLDRRYHWNNLEVGCHIEMKREPNVYDPDLVNAMCFFHV